MFIMYKASVLASMLTIQATFDINWTSRQGRGMYSEEGVGLHSSTTPMFILLPGPDAGPRHPAFVEGDYPSITQKEIKGVTKTLTKLTKRIVTYRILGKNRG